MFIKVKLKTREKLKANGKKGDTYDDVISKMFDQLFAELPKVGGIAEAAEEHMREREGKEKGEE